MDSDDRYVSAEIELSTSMDMVPNCSERSEVQETFVKKKDIVTTAWGLTPPGEYGTVESTGLNGSFEKLLVRRGGVHSLEEDLL